jgi:hypothetical protein
MNLDPVDYSTTPASNEASSGDGRYGSSLCAKAYIVQIIEGPTTNPDNVVEVGFPDGSLVTADACTGSHLMAYGWSFYFDDTGAKHTTYLGSSEQYGVWSTPGLGISFCDLNIVRTDWLKGPAGTFYQVAVSARRPDNSTAPVSVIALHH